MCVCVGGGGGGGLVKFHEGKPKNSLSPSNTNPKIFALPKNLNKKP
jgi:hypothetical protein